MLANLVQLAGPIPTGRATRTGRTAPGRRSSTSSSPAAPPRRSTAASSPAVGELATPGAPGSAVGDAGLRAAGLSGNKLASLRDLSAKALDGSATPVGALSKRSDDELVAELQTVRGIGRWTAEMYLMFELRPARRLAGRRPRRAPGLRRRLGPRAERPRPAARARWASASARTGRSSRATAGRQLRCWAPARTPPCARRNRRSCTCDVPAARDLAGLVRATHPPVRGVGNVFRSIVPGGC